jgi:hypothetical protein
MLIPLTASQVSLVGTTLESEPAGDLFAAVRAHVAGDGPPGLVVLGTFGSGKTQLCSNVASTSEIPATVVPLRDVARHGSIEDGLTKVVGKTRLEEARDGRRVLLLDGLDEVPPPRLGYGAFFHELVDRSGPRWVLTSRPGHFRTDPAEPAPDQVDVLGREDIATLVIDPLPTRVAHDAIGALPGGAHLIDSVEGLAQLATSPLLLHVVHAALPFIEPGRPIQAWGVFDAWIRYGLSTGPGHDRVVNALEQLAMLTFEARGRTMEVPTFHCDELDALPVEVRRALLVTELDGRWRFGHRSVYEFLLASRFGPAIRMNQGYGPDSLSGVRITEAIRVFLVGRCGPMPVVVEGDRTLIPRGNFVAGGDMSPDERDLRIEHLERPVWVSRAPVTNAEWAAFVAARPDDRIDANYLPHWGSARKFPADQGDVPVYHVWPEDADRYAAWAGGRLPSADEWEKAARGLDGRRWPWGDHWKPGHAVTSEVGVERPLPVRAFGAHGDAGLFSASGGVFEYTASAYRGRPDRGRVVMGGCYTHPALTSRLSLRLSHKLSGHLKTGLRMAWDPE